MCVCVCVKFLGIICPWNWLIKYLLGGMSRFVQAKLISFCQPLMSNSPPIPMRCLFFPLSSHATNQL